MSQILSRYQSTVGGVTNAAPATLIQIPYRSSSPNTIVNLELKCMGVTTVSGVIKRLYFVIPILYHSVSGAANQIPASGNYVYTDTVFSQFDFTDDGSISDFRLGVFAQAGGGSNGINIEVTAPNTGTSWTFYAYVDIPKEE